jgi:MFS family permease
MTRDVTARALSGTFNRFWCATGLSALGNGLHRSSVPLIAAAITRDPVTVGAIIASSRLPWLILSFKVGVWIDRRSPSEVIRIGASVRVIAATLLAVFLLGTWNSTLVLCALVFAVASGEVMGDTSAQAWVAYSEKPSAYPMANARIYGTQVLLGQLSGPVLAGLLLSYAIYLASAVCGILQLVAAVALQRVIRVRTVEPSARPREDRSDLTSNASQATKIDSALSYILAQRCLVGLVLLGVVSMTIYGMWVTAIVLFATDPRALDLSPTQYGLLMLTTACGSLLGTAAMPWLLRATNGFWCVAASCVGVSALPLGAAVSNSVPLVCASMFAYGFLLSAWNVSAVSFRQAKIPIQLLGRVNALYRLATWGAMPIGAVLAGILCAYANTHVVFLVCIAMSLLQYPALVLVREMKGYRG